jgi:UDP-N-acetylmuramyl pentapeptide phosphotransferase/UDP-N-acetylglucosamine-1-phosphate transferase
MTTPSYSPAPAASGKKTMAILSLVFGIVSIVFCLFLPILWILLAIAGVVLGFMSRNREPQARTLSLVGIILSFVGIAANIGSMVLGAVIATSMMQS